MLSTTLLLGGLDDARLFRDNGHFDLFPQGRIDEVDRRS